MAETLGDWVFEGMLQFLRSPLWNAPVQSFIEEHCGTFKPEEEENRLEYTEIHNKFRILIDDLLSSFLSELGASPEAFVDAVKKGVCPELSEMITEYIVALDDFRSFRAMMEKRNIEMELEAMYEAARMSAALQQAGGVTADMDDQERFLLEMAIHASLTEHEIIVKRIEKEDAELLQALAMSIAMEQERCMLEQMRLQTAELAKEVQAESHRNVERIKAEVHEKRVENVQQGAAQLAEVHPAAPPKVPEPQAASPARAAPPVAPPPAPAPAPTPVPVAPAQAAAAEPVTAPPLATTGIVGGLPGLKPVAERRTAAFGAKPLPFLAPKSDAPPLPPAPAEAPKLKELAAAKAPEVAQAQANQQPSAEDMARREAYLKAQREKLRAQKEQSRREELEKFVTGGSSEATPAAATSAPAGQMSEDELRQQRLAFARRFKEDLIEETRKAAKRGE